MAQSIINTRIGVVVVPERLQLAPGASASVVLLVTNNSPVVDQVSVSVDGLDPAWFTVRAGVVNVFPSSQDRLELDIHLPGDATAGLRNLQLNVVGRAAPDTPVVVALPVEVLALGSIDVRLSPLRVTIGRRGAGRFSLDIANSSNAERLIDLAVDDPDQLLEVRFSPDRLAVPAGVTVQSLLTVRPRKRPLIALPRSYPFMVTAVDAPGDPGADNPPPELIAAVAGELAYTAPLAAFAGLLPGLKRALLALAALALALALLIWFLGEPGRASALRQQIPVAKPLVDKAEDAHVAVASAVAASAGGSAAAPPPQIKKFVLATPGQDGRTDYALVWDVSGADVVTVDGVQQADPNSGSLHLEKLDNTEHTLEASQGGASVHQSVGIVILRAPDIQRFVAVPDSIAPGQSASLQWQTVRADRATVGDQSVTPGGGALAVTPATTTSYTLVVENELGRTQQSVQVAVVTPTP
jgi:hypothetical protein